MSEAHYQQARTALDELLALPEHGLPERHKLYRMVRWQPEKESDAIHVVLPPPGRLGTLAQALLHNDVSERLCAYATEKQAYDVAAIAAHTANQPAAIARAMDAWLDTIITSYSVNPRQDVDRELLHFSTLLHDLRMHNKEYRTKHVDATVNVAYTLALIRANLDICRILSQASFTPTPRTLQEIERNISNLQDALAASTSTTQLYTIAGRFARVLPTPELRARALQQFVDHAYEHLPAQEALVANYIILKSYFSPHLPEHRSTEKQPLPEPSARTAALKSIKPVAEDPESESVMYVSLRPQKPAEPQRAPEGPSVILEE